MEGAKETPTAIDRTVSANSANSSSFSQLEIKTLRRVRDDIPKRLWAVALIGFWERAAFWGLTAPWQNYMQHPEPLDHEDTPGALGLGQARATRIYCAFYVFYYVTPLAFAAVSDSYLGRYKTLLISVVLYNIGCAAMTVSSLSTILEKGWGLLGLIFAMVVIGLGGGGFRAIMVAFIADQCPEQRPQIKTLKSGERVVTDHELTIQYIYNLYYWLGNVGSLSWFATVTLEKKASFTCAYGLTFTFMVVALLMLVIGRKWYVKVPHEANILPQATKILICACRNGFSLAHADPFYQLEHHRKTVPWSGQLVEELYRGVRACRVLLAFVVFYICFDQMQNNLISQAAQMETLGMPNDMMPALNQVGCIVLGPLVQSALYPLLHKRGIYLKPITRIAIGFGFIALSMLYATIVQQIVYTTGPCYASPNKCGPTDSFRGPNDVNVWIQAPLYFFIAAGEIFAYVTALEYAYNHAPKDMKAIVQAISLLVAGIGSACAMGLTPIARDPYLVVFYASLTGAMTATTIIFWFLFRKYDKDHPLDYEETDGRVESAHDLERCLPQQAGDSILTLQPQSLSDLAITPVTDDADVEQRNQLVKLATSSTKQEQTAPMPFSSTNVTLVDGMYSKETTPGASAIDLIQPKLEVDILRTETAGTSNADVGWCENPRSAPPIPSRRMSKGLLKEASPSNPEIEYKLELEGRTSSASANSLGDRKLSSGESSGRSSSTYYEAVTEHPTSVDDAGLASVGSTEEAPQGTQRSPPNPNGGGSASRAVPDLVARFEELSRANSDASNGLPTTSYREARRPSRGSDNDAATPADPSVDADATPARPESLEPCRWRPGFHSQSSYSNI